MSEDDTFLHAILAAPGDETARLVYADWLDERHDPRGPYLRAECRWASPWHSGAAPSDSQQLRDAARPLDPLWVLRVTRPPVGVCCDHLHLTGHGVPTHPDRLPELEQALRITLPLAYRAFLLNYDHVLGTSRFRGPHPQTGRLMEFRFFPIDPVGFAARGSYGRQFGWWNCPSSGREPCLQIGLFGKGGHCVLQVGVDPATGRDQTGEVWYYTRHADLCWRHAHSLPAFLTLLRRV